MPGNPGDQEYEPNRQRTSDRPGHPPPGSAVAPLDAPDLTRLAERLAVQEAIAADLHDQMLASSELIKILADQNSLLIARVDTHRRRIAWLTAATVVLAIGLVAMALLGR